MKKILILIQLIMLIFVISGCQKNDDIVDNEKITVVTTIFPYYDFTREIAEDKVNLHMLLKAGVETHSYEPTPKDIKMIQNANLFIYTGGENDVWVEKILNSMGKNRPKTLKILEYLEMDNVLLEEEHIHNPEEEHNHIDEHINDDSVGIGHKDEMSHTEIDEHVWTSPKNAMVIVEKIAKILSEMDKKNADMYIKNSEKYIHQDLDKLHNSIKNIVANSKIKTLVFGDRFPFRYLANEYGLDYYAVFSGCSTETEANPTTVAKLIDKVKEEKIPVIFSIELSNGSIADTIADATDTKRLQLHSVHNVTKDEFERGETYVSIMEKNAKNLKEALN